MSVTFRIDSPHSAHPTLVSHLDLLSSHPNCSLAFLHILPADLIVDRFQLRDLYVEGRVVSSNERLPLPSTSSLRIDADRDLEAPVYNLDQRETYLVIDLPEATSAHVSLPVHIRYQAPRAAPSPPGHRRVSVASGHIVATCPRGRGASTWSLS